VRDRRRRRRSDGSTRSARGLWFARVPGVEPDYLRTWLPGQLLNGIGVGMVMPSLAGAAVAHLPPAQFGVGSAVNQAVRQMGAVLGVALTVALVGHAALQQSDFRTLYACQIALAVVTAVLCIPVDTRPRRGSVTAGAPRRAAR
jgi:MFS family permease